MNFFNRAWRYVSRKLSKSILLGITFFVIGNLVIICLGISDAANSAKIITRKSMKAVVNYEVDNQAFWNYTDTLESDEDREAAYKNYPKIDNEIVLKLAADEHVKAVNYISASQMYSSGFDNVLVGNEDKKAENGGGMVVMDGGMTTTYVESNIMVQTNMFPDSIEFVEGTNKLVDGRMYSQEDITNANKVVLITKDLADLNGLTVGDTIKLTSNAPGQGSYLTEMQITEEMSTLELEIIGIYTTTATVDTNDPRFNYLTPAESPKNFVLVPGTTMMQFNYEISLAIYNFYVSKGEVDMYGEMPTLEGSYYASKVVYLLDDPLQVDAFVEQYKSSLKEFTLLNANNEQFKKLAKPLDTLSFFANVIVTIISINAIVIISLVTALTLKTREFEIGVLLSLGVSKVKVVMQLFTELLIIALLGFTLAVISGSLVAGEAGKMVLNYQQSNTEEEVTTNDNKFVWAGDQDYFTEITQEDILNQYNVSISIWIILEIYIMGIGVVFISIVIPSAMIMRLNPKQILLA